MSYVAVAPGLSGLSGNIALESALQLKESGKVPLVRSLPPKTSLTSPIAPKAPEKAPPATSPATPPVAPPSGEGGTGDESAKGSKLPLIVGGLALAGAAAFFVMRKRKAA